jgi:hypothetical protein
MKTQKLKRFPFSDRRSAENAVLAMASPNPGRFIINADRPGVGKTELARAILRAQGIDPIEHLQPRTWRRTCEMLRSAERQGYLWLDDFNLRSKRDRETLEHISLRCAWDGDALNRVEKFTLPKLIIVTGNGLQITPVLRRRFHVIQLGEVEA